MGGTGAVTPGLGAGVISSVLEPGNNAATGLVTGEGLLPVPEKLAKKILELEFIEMRELMPENWLKEEEEGKNVFTFPKRRSPPITDVLHWLQCFAAMVGVLSRKYPRMIPELMGYQSLIIKCSRDFEGLAWAQYDRAYRRQAAQSKDLRWSRLNPTLYKPLFRWKGTKKHSVLPLPQ